MQATDSTLRLVTQPEEIPLEPVKDETHLARLHTRLLLASQIAQEGVSSQSDYADLCRALHFALEDVELLIKAAVWREGVKQ